MGEKISMLKKMGIGAVALLCLLASGVAVYMRMNTDDHLSDLGFENYTVTGVISGYIEDLDVYSTGLIERLDMSSLIAKVRFTGKREAMYRSLLSEVEVLDVIRGDRELAGKRIGVYEEVRLFYIRGGQHMGFETTNAMREGETYFVFVNPLGIRNSTTLGCDEYTGECQGITWDMAVWYPPYIYPTDFDWEDIAVVDGTYWPYSELEQYSFVTRNSSDGQKLFSALERVYAHFGLRSDG